MVKDLLVDHGSLKQYQKSSSDAPLPLIRSALVWCISCGQSNTLGLSFLRIEMEASTHALTARTHDRPKLHLLLAHKQDLPKLHFPELSDDHNAFLNCLLTSEQAKHETVQYVAKFCSLDVNWPNSSEANKLREAFKQTYFTHMWQGSVEHAAQFLVNTGEEESTFAQDPFEIRKRLGIMMLQQPSSADKVSGKFTFRQSCLRCYYDFWVSTLKQAVAFMNTVQQYREVTQTSVLKKISFKFKFPF